MFLRNRTDLRPQLTNGILSLGQWVDFFYRLFYMFAKFYCSINSLNTNNHLQQTQQAMQMDLAIQYMTYQLLLVKLQCNFSSWR